MSNTPRMPLARAAKNAEEDATAYRIRDGYGLLDGFGEYATPNEAIDGMRNTVDEMIDDYGGRSDRWENRG